MTLPQFRVLTLDGNRARTGEPARRPRRGDSPVVDRASSTGWSPRAGSSGPTSTATAAASRSRSRPAGQTAYDAATARNAPRRSTTCSARPTRRRGRRSLGGLVALRTLLQERAQNAGGRMSVARGRVAHAAAGTEGSRRLDPPPGAVPARAQAQRRHGVRRRRRRPGRRRARAAVVQDRSSTTSSSITGDRSAPWLILLVASGVSAFAPGVRPPLRRRAGRARRAVRPAQRGVRAPAAARLRQPRPAADRPARQPRVERHRAHPGAAHVPADHARQPRAARRRARRDGDRLSPPLTLVALLGHPRDVLRRPAPAARRSSRRRGTRSSAPARSPAWSTRPSPACAW